jgi:hypothetical protein
MMAARRSGVVDRDNIDPLPRQPLQADGRAPATAPNSEIALRNVTGRYRPRRAVSHVLT